MSKARDLADFSSVAPDIGRRNLIINGAMQVWQRGTSGFTTNEYHADRWETGISGATELTYSVARSNDAPSGYGYSMVFQVNTAESTFGSSLFASIRTKLEGQNLQGIAKGTSDAESLTLSFWVKGSVTGTYVCELYDGDNTRQASKTYTINSANTWEKKTLTFDPDTTGDFDNDANLSLWVFFGLGGGSTYTSGTNSEGAWANAVSANRYADQNNTFLSTASATVAITGVQLEVGTVATPFEHRSYGEELDLCTRYFQKCDNWHGAPNGSTLWLGVLSLSKPMRAVPSLTATGPIVVSDFRTQDATQSSAEVTLFDSDGFQGTSLCVRFGNFSGLTVGRYYGGARGTNSNYIEADAEL